MSEPNVELVRRIHAGSGILVEDTTRSVWTFRDGLVVRVHFERALQAAGLRP